MKGWYGDTQRHSMASKGIKSTNKYWNDLAKKYTKFSREIMMAQERPEYTKWIEDNLDELKTSYEIYSDNEYRVGFIPQTFDTWAFEKFLANNSFMAEGMPKTKAEARQEAIDWQNWASEQNLSYGELSEYQDHFKKTGKKFGLTREFRENGII